MLRSLRQLYGKKLGASDGNIGHVKDFYFNLASANVHVDDWRTKLFSVRSLS